MSVFKKLLECSNQNSTSLNMFYESRKMYLFYDAFYLIKNIKIRNNLLNHKIILLLSATFLNFFNLSLDIDTVKCPPEGNSYHREAERQPSHYRISCKETQKKHLSSCCHELFVDDSITKCKFYREGDLPSYL